MTRLLFALAAALLLTPGAAASPSLRGDITVNHAVVTVGDMFDDAGSLAETAIFRAPAPGMSGVVELADVQRAARLAGLADFDNVGYTRVRVGRASTIVDAPLLGGLISDELARRGVTGNGISADTRFDIANVSLNAEQGPVPASLVTLRYTPGSAAFAARFAIAGIDQPVDLTGTVTLMTSVPKLNSNAAAGTILAPEDFDLAQVSLATAQAGAYASLDQLVGKQLLRPSRAGLMLKPTDVSNPWVVTRNGPVTVLFRVGAMILTVKGQALGTASAGEPVDVLNTMTRKILHGIAQADGTVVIPTATTTASL